MTANICRECGARTGKIAVETGVCSDCLKLIMGERDVYGERYKQWPINLPKADHWLLIGSSPSMPFFMDYLVKDCGYDLSSPDLIVATTNAGIHETTRQGCHPDYYAVLEVASPKYYSQFYEPEREKYGTKIVTSSLANNNKIQVDADLILEITGWSDMQGFKRGAYITGGTSGSHLIQLAVNMGAKRVDVVGMEGYRSTPATQVVDTFDGRKGPDYGEAHTRKWYGPLMQQVVDACPDVEFQFFGDIRYKIEGPNVVRITEETVKQARAS